MNFDVQIPTLSTGKGYKTDSFPENFKTPCVLNIHIVSRVTDTLPDL